MDFSFQVAPKIPKQFIQKKHKKDSSQSQILVQHCATNCGPK